MTNEERDKAIRILQWLHDNDFLFRSTEEDVKYATKLAIQELEQEPCDKYIKEIDHLRKYIYKLETQIVEQESCEDAISRSDAISRQDALDAFGLSEKTRKYGGDHSGYDSMMLYEIQDVIEGLPSVSTEKTGRWIYKTMKGQFCSICDEQSVWKFKYCPNCGAKMVEPLESEDKE